MALLLLLGLSKYALCRNRCSRNATSRHLLACGSSGGCSRVLQAAPGGGAGVRLFSGADDWLIPHCIPTSSEYSCIAFRRAWQAIGTGIHGPQRAPEKFCQAGVITALFPATSAPERSTQSLRTITSTRRFRAQPSSVVLVAIGKSSPMPTALS